MSRPLSLWLAGSLIVALLLAAHPAVAGSASAPEINDAAGDEKFSNSQLQTIPSDQLGLAKPTDLLHLWIDNETSTNVTVHIQINVNIDSGLIAQLAKTPTATYTYTFQAVAGLRAVKATVLASATGTPPTTVTLAGKDSARNVTYAGSVMQFQIPRSAMDNATAGSRLTNLTLSATGMVLGQSSPLNFVDTAPDSGFGTNYTFTMDTKGHETVPGTGGGSQNPDGAPGCTYKASETNRTDSDADCLPDWWEKKYFGNLTQNGTGDPDHDGCDNRCEYLHGTDPTKADTDGDGCSDGAEVRDGTDPTNPASFSAYCGKAATTTTTPTGTTPTGTGTGSTTASTSTTGSSSTTSGTTTDQSPLDKIQADSGYAVASGASLGAIVLISLIALFGRWGL